MCIFVLGFFGVKDQIMGVEMDVLYCVWDLFMGELVDDFYWFMVRE